MDSILNFKFDALPSITFLGMVLGILASNSYFKPIPLKLL